jgi:lysophospholipase L1-like esterase
MVFIILLLAIFAYTIIVSIYIIKPPKNNPKHYLKRIEPVKDKQKKVIAFIGDSITHGTVSCDYTKILSNRLQNFSYINAGINGDLTFNVLQRIDEIVLCRPDFITVLLGTNDVNGSFSLKIARGYERSKKVPKSPDFWEEDRFKEDYTKIIRILKQTTNAKIAILSIPPLGEMQETFQFKRSVHYSNIIKGIGKEYDVPYLPLNEKMVTYLNGNPTQSDIPYDKYGITNLKSIIAHYFLRKSWNQISQKNGFRLLTDNIHLNTIGATMIADLIEDFLHI